MIRSGRGKIWLHRFETYIVRVVAAIKNSSILGDVLVQRDQGSTERYLNTDQLLFWWLRDYATRPLGTRAFRTCKHLLSRTGDLEKPSDEQTTPPASNGTVACTPANITV